MPSSNNLRSSVIVAASALTAELTSKQGFRLEASCMDRIRRRGVPTRRNGHDVVIRKEHLVLFKKAR
jgi:hypothetical protein